METKHQIRVVALGLISNGDRTFVSSSYEPMKQRTFYRALGGGVEFGESSFEALQREFQEEIQAELSNIHYLGCIENQFTYLNQPQHEIIQLYRCDFADPKFYQVEKVTFYEGNDEAIVAQWVEVDRFKSGELWLVPEECLRYV